MNLIIYFMNKWLFIYLFSTTCILNVQRIERILKDRPTSSMLPKTPFKKGFLSQMVYEIYGIITFDYLCFFMTLLVLYVTSHISI